MIFSYQFVQRAMIAALFAGIISGLLGTLITEKKKIMMTSGVAHASFGGIGLGYLIGVDPMIPALGVAGLVVMIMKRMEKKLSSRSDTVMGMLWALGMALGMIFVGLRPGYPPDMTSYLFGDILTISQRDLLFMVFVSLTFVVIFSFRFEQWKLILFDEEHAVLQGLAVDRYMSIFYLSIAVGVIAMIKVVGIILTLAILTTPPMTARLFTKRLLPRIILATVFAWATIFIGFFLSFMIDVPSGAMIIFVSVLVYFMMAGGKKIAKVLAIHH